MNLLENEMGFAGHTRELPQLRLEWWLLERDHSVLLLRFKRLFEVAS